METLAETSWDVTIAGTGLAQSLLALSLSRSGKKVLHLDQNPFYGGSEAAFSLDEAQEWANSVNQNPGCSPFEDAKIVTYRRAQDSSSPDSFSNSAERGENAQEESGIHPKLSPSRAYTISLSPYFLYTRSQLISTLLSSKVYRQLDFMAVGSWWIHSPQPLKAESGEHGASEIFHRVPGNREDVFADKNISMKSKRTLMKFLRHISKSEDEESDEDDTDLSMSFEDYLSTEFGVPQDLHNPLLSLSLSQFSQKDTPASYAVPRVKRHLSSIGALGAGFGSVTPKYGGGSEILQVACRASAVGGGVYALDTGIQAYTDGETSTADEYHVSLQLRHGESVRTKALVGSGWDIPAQEQSVVTKVARSITIVSSAFQSLFPITVEGAPMPASAVLMFPGDTLDDSQSRPVYLQIHSSDTGDCPREQSIIYATVSVPGREGQNLLQSAVDRLLRAEGPQATVLWSMRYTQSGRLSNDGTQPVVQEVSPHIYKFPPPNLDLAIEDEVVDMVKQAWMKIVGNEVAPDDFMIFDERDGTFDE